MEPSVAKKYTGRGDTAHTFLMVEQLGLGKNLSWVGGDTAHTLLMGQTIGWGHRTALEDQDTHNIPAS